MSIFDPQVDGSVKRGGHGACLGWTGALTHVWGDPDPLWQGAVGQLIVEHGQVLRLGQPVDVSSCGVVRHHGTVDRVSNAVIYINGD